MSPCVVEHIVLLLFVARRTPDLDAVDAVFYISVKPGHAVIFIRVGEDSYASRAVNGVDNFFYADELRLDYNIFGLSGLKSSLYISP